MYRAIITPTHSKLTIELPEELLGQPVEVLAFRIQKYAGEVKTKPSAEEIKRFYSTYQVDMSAFKFDRDQANER